MVEMKTPHKARIQVAVALLSEFTRQLNQLDRAKAVDLLRKSYEARKINPIRGKTQPPDLYDKEMATLYVIGKYGLKLDLEYPELVEKIFYIEKNLEEALDDIVQNKFQEAREKLKRLSPTGVIDSNTIARLLRIPLTRLMLGFISEEEFKSVMQKVLEAIPEEEKTLRNYARFFVAYKLAEAIYKGEVKTREEKEALKKALAIRIGFPKSTPSDEYTAAIATQVFNIDEKTLEKILGIRKQKTSQESTGKSLS